MYRVLYALKYALCTKNPAKSREGMVQKLCMPVCLHYSIIPVKCPVSAARFTMYGIVHIQLVKCPVSAACFTMYGIVHIQLGKCPVSAACFTMYGIVHIQLGKCPVSAACFTMYGIVHISS